MLPAPRLSVVASAARAELVPAANPFWSIRGPPPRSTLFPYTTLFRSVGALAAQHLADAGDGAARADPGVRSEEHTSELQSLTNLVCRLLLEKKKQYRRGGDAGRACSLRGRTMAHPDPDDGRAHDGLER